MPPCCQRPLHLAYHASIACAGNSVRTGCRGQATAPGWRHCGSVAGQEPETRAPGRGLSRETAAPAIGQERRRGAQAAPRINTREARPSAPLPDCFLGARERSLKWPDRKRGVAMAVRGPSLPLEGRVDPRSGSGWGKCGSAPTSSFISSSGFQKRPPLRLGLRPRHLSPTS